LVQHLPGGVTENLYTKSDTLFGGMAGFSGRSNGWITTSFAWENCAVKSASYGLDTVIIRFNFLSDSTDNDKEGWVIDDIQLFSIEIGSYIANNTGQSLFEVFPNPAGEYAVVRSSLAITRLEIIDYSGKLIRSLFPNSFETNIDVDGMPEGIYLIRAFNGNSYIGTNKILITR
jgi:hypothetical protein